MNLTTVSARQVIGSSTAQDGESRVDIDVDVDMDVDGVVVVVVEGDIDLYTGPDLRQALVDLLVPSAADPGGTRGAGGSEKPSSPDATADRGGPSEAVWAVVVDLSEVEFIDSFALGVLVQGHHLARRSGHTYALVATHPMIHKLFEITGLARVLPLHPDVASAVEGLRVARAATGDVPG